MNPQLKLKKCRYEIDIYIIMYVAIYIKSQTTNTISTLTRLAYIIDIYC